MKERNPGTQWVLASARIDRAASGDAVQRDEVRRHGNQRLLSVLSDLVPT